MSQHAVERTIGKLVTDEEFRRRFFENPAVATWEAGLPLSAVELEALSALSRAAVTRFGQSLDARISRLSLGAASASEATRRGQHASSERSDSGKEKAT